jgi:hypothetical protein
MRTFVIADAHGHPEVIRKALDHGGFEPGRDGFVFGGDFLDRGPDAQGCLDLINQYATEVLMGNHDLAVLLDSFVWPQQPESLSYRPLLIERALHRDPADSWKAVAEVEGVLVSHAGISARYERVFRATCGGETSLFAEHMNEQFRDAIRRRLELGEAAGGDCGEDDPDADLDPDVDLESDRDAAARSLLGDYGPFWFRPPPFTRARPLAGVTQIAGHSPAVPELAREGFHMIDPLAWLADGSGKVHYRYALIEDGCVRVEDGDVDL